MRHHTFHKYLNIPDKLNQMKYALFTFSLFLLLSCSINDKLTNRFPKYVLIKDSTIDNYIFRLPIDTLQNFEGIWQGHSNGICIDTVIYKGEKKILIDSLNSSYAYLDSNQITIILKNNKSYFGGNFVTIKIKDHKLEKIGYQHIDNCTNTLDSLVLAKNARMILKNLNRTLGDTIMGYYEFNRVIDYKNDSLIYRGISKGYFKTVIGKCTSVSRNSCP